MKEHKTQYSRPFNKLQRLISDYNLLIATIHPTRNCTTLCNAGKDTIKSKNVSPPDSQLKWRSQDRIVFILTSSDVACLISLST